MTKYIILSILVLASVQSKAFDLSDLSSVSCNDSMMNVDIDLQNGILISQAQHGTSELKITNIQYANDVISFDFENEKRSSNGFTIEDIFEVPSSGKIYGSLYLGGFKQAGCAIYRK